MDHGEERPYRLLALCHNLRSKCNRDAIRYLARETTGSLLNRCHQAARKLASNAGLTVAVDAVAT